MDREAVSRAQGSIAGKARIMTTFLSNAFSINMLERANQRVHFVPASVEEARAHLSWSDGFTCAIGHADTAAVVASDLDLPLEACRVDVQLRAGDILVAAQYRGPRLPEGATTLPVGAAIEYWVTYIQERD